MHEKQQIEDNAVTDKDLFVKKSCYYTYFFGLYFKSTLFDN